MGKFSAYRFLNPPRPKTKINPMTFPHLEREGDWWAQFKKNGTNNPIAISPRRTIIAKTRQQTDHKQWAPSPHTIVPFRNLPGGWYYFCTELVHSKVKAGAARGLSDIIFIHDILVADSQTLYGMTFADRQALLARLFKVDRLAPSLSGSHYVIDRHTWLARNHQTGFAKLFSGLSSPEDEGLVFKRSTSILAPCISTTSNQGWSLKIRVPTANSNYDS